eukprot:1312845-Heterocapsa_arctica.AAC.1
MLLDRRPSTTTIIISGCLMLTLAQSAEGHVPTSPRTYGIPSNRSSSALRWKRTAPGSGSGSGKPGPNEGAIPGVAATASSLGALPAGPGLLASPTQVPNSPHR